MANWLLDYFEMTEYIPSELREQLTSIRELDLQVHNAMDDLERDIKQFFSKINTLSQQERQDQYDAFLKKCDVATRAASDKVKVADKLHDLVEKSMRLLDQGLEKLKEDLLEGDKAYIVEDLERRSQELDEQIRLEHETLLQRQQQKTYELKTPHSKGHRISSSNESNSNHVNYSQNNHRHSLPAQQNNHHNHHNHHHHQHTTATTTATATTATTTNYRSRNNSTGAQNSVGRQKKRERKRLNSTMTIFNRNSRIEDDSSTNQTFLSSPLTPEFNLTPGAHNSTNRPSSVVDDIAGVNNSSLTLKGMVAGNRNLTGINDKSNGNDQLAGAKQPILTAIDAAHAVSPNATNSDKLVLFSSNANGDNYNNPTHNNDNKQNHSNSLSANQQHLYQSQQHLLLQQQQQQHQQTQLQQHQNQLSNHLLAPVGYNSVDNNTLGSSNTNLAISKSERHNHDQKHKTGGPFSALPLSSRHDPIMMAASQAISATQNMTLGRRTSSLKASYAAVNSGRLQTAPNQQLFDQTGLVPEVYCTCRSHIQDSHMIACDNSKCKIEWFHYECVGITTPPEGEWYCDECRASIDAQKSTKQPRLEGVDVT